MVFLPNLGNQTLKEWCKDREPAAVYYDHNCYVVNATLAPFDLHANSSCKNRTNGQLAVLDRADIVTNVSAMIAQMPPISVCPAAEKQNFFHMFTKNYA